jgi:hypothetical protein
MKFISQVGLLAVVLMLLTNILTAQTSKDEKVTEIHNYYNKVVNELSKYTKKEVYKEAYIDLDGWGMDFIAYFDSKNQLVFLRKKENGDRGNFNAEYLFINGKISFIFIQNEEFGTQERIYFWDSKIIEAYKKDKSSDGNIDFSKLENKPNTDILNSLAEKTKYYLDFVKSDLKVMNEALKNKK